MYTLPFISVLAGLSDARPFAMRAVFLSGRVLLESDFLVFFPETLGPSASFETGA